MSFRNRSAHSHQFAAVPRSDIPRSQFIQEKSVKATFDAAYLVPVLVKEVLPGDTFNVRMTAFCRLATPINPFYDNLWLESFFFFVPNRLVWTNWVKFMGEQTNPGDSISYIVPTCQSPVLGYAVGSLQDHMGLPTVGQIQAGAATGHQNLPMRMYNLIYNEWFRDENLQASLVVDKDDGPDNPADYVLRKRGKRHDYFTSCLPFVQKGSSVTLPLGTTAPVVSTGDGVPKFSFGVADNPNRSIGATPAGTTVQVQGGALAGAGARDATWYDPKLEVNLSAATAATINQIRQAFQIQKLLERDARGGTRYTEIVRSHFGVVSPDARLQRPEYLGGGRVRIAVNPVAQTSASAASGSTTPLGNLAAIGTALAHSHGFVQSFVEHGYVIGLINVRADLTYQQGIPRHYNRSTRYDFYFPVFSHLGEQPVYNREIFHDGGANDVLVFGYQERWAEYRYEPSEVHGLFRSTATGTLDVWHLAQKFTSLPTLNSTFITDSAEAVVDRVIATPSQPQFLADIFFKMKVARPVPMFSQPGFVDHF